jgi:uncharacterized protein (TIGR02145 family)
MKTKILLSLLALGLIVNIFGQTIELNFTAVDNTTHIEFDSIKIINYSQQLDTMLYWPDTVLMLYYVGMQNNVADDLDFRISQNYPNPVLNQTNIKLCTFEKGEFNLSITDGLGRQIINTKMILNKACHEFIFKPGNSNIYLFTAIQNHISKSIKIINMVNTNSNNCILEYNRNRDVNTLLKNTKDIQQFSFTLGDELLYIGYYDTLESGMYNKPESSENFVIQFATNIPCPGIPTIDYGDQIYNTIQICNQCWMQENLNVGIKINAPELPTDNDIIEKYCMGNLSYYCISNGGLYFWNEMMNYTHETGGQGICPDGWHIPNDMDWQILEGTVDSEFKIGDSEWQNYSWRGNNAGGNLKKAGTTNWEYPNTGATNAYGFTALPSGYFVQGEFWGPAYKSYLWSSNVNGKYFRNMDWNQKMIKKNTGGENMAFSVRCIKNN